MNYFNHAYFILDLIFKISLLASIYYQHKRINNMWEFIIEFIVSNRKPKD